MFATIVRKLTWVDIPDGGGGYPMSWKKGWREYVDMIVNTPIILFGLLFALILGFFLDP
ncbi:MAG: hypothetical protein Q8P12_03345 [bacterium]|nr:hypothetical protein [bacterium]